jgi:hypothetical protein|tara:strand:+ start:254 stop:862 length:609 start_codon:yes stop_codon:yes gene_type:complete
MPEGPKTALVSPFKPAFSIDKLMEELWAEEVGPYKEKIKRPYKDSKGKWTIGVGHLIGDGSQKAYEESDFYNKSLTDKEVVDLARKDSGKKIKLVLDRFGKGFFDFQPELQLQIVSSYYRGGLPGSPKTLEHMAKGEFDLASKEFLNNDEYRESLRDKTGIAPRMMKLSKALAQEHAVRGQKKGGEDKNISFPEAVERALNP